jgi:hypothetical protein
LNGPFVSKSTTSPENTALEYPSSLGAPAYAQEQAEAQSGSKTTRPRAVGYP